MLFNPSLWDYMLLHKMRDRSTTLSWLWDMFVETQLGLNNMSIFDMFLMLQDNLQNNVLS